MTDLARLETLRVELRDDGVAVLTLNRPERANSQTVTMFHEFGDAAAALRRSGARALVVRGAGSGRSAPGSTSPSCTSSARWGPSSS